jgi:SPP1 family predicted phage head-tail adaptor
MRAGRLDKLIALQSRSTSQDAYGEQLTTWTSVAAVWASIQDMSGREFFAAQAAQNPVQTKITIRYRAGVVPAMRAVYKSDVYNIQAVLGQDNTYLQLMCSRGVTDG